MFIKQIKYNLAINVSKYSIHRRIRKCKTTFEFKANIFRSIIYSKGANIFKTFKYIFDILVVIAYCPILGRLYKIICSSLDFLLSVFLWTSYKPYNYGLIQESVQALRTAYSPTSKLNTATQMEKTCVAKRFGEKWLRL